MTRARGDRSEFAREMAKRFVEQRASKYQLTKEIWEDSRDENLSGEAADRDSRRHEGFWYGLELAK